MTGETVVLINRTAGPLNVVKDGRQRVLKPGKNLWSSDWVRFAKLQNPRMGTFDASGMEGEYLVGVEGFDDCSPIEPGQEHKGNKLERFDRTQMDDEASQAVPLNTGVQPPMRRIPGEAWAAAPGEDVMFANRNR